MTKEQIEVARAKLADALVEAQRKFDEGKGRSPAFAFGFLEAAVSEALFALKPKRQRK